MITNALIAFGVAIGNFILSVFPDGSGFPSTFTDAVTTFSGYLAILNPIFPYETLLQIIQLVIAYQLIVLAWRGTRWLVSHLPFIGGNG